MESLERLIAKSEIEDCLKRYARGVDRREWGMVRDCFYDDATDHHGEFHGNGDQFVEWVRTRHADLPFSMHYLLNCIIEFHSGDSAVVETYFWATQRREEKAADGSISGTDHEVFGRYLDRFDKREGSWRIADRKVAYDSTRQVPSTNHLRKMVGVIGRRDRTDQIYELLKPPM